MIYTMPKNDWTKPERYGEQIEAEKTCVPGLLILKWEKGVYSLTHSSSGMAVIATRRDYTIKELKQCAETISRLGVDWTVKEPREVYSQMLPLSDEELRAFFTVINRTPPSDRFLANFRDEQEREKHLKNERRMLV